MATNTTATTQTHNGTGSQANFAISFSFLADSEVDVTVGGVLKTLGTHYTISGSTVTFTSGNIPPSGTGNIKFTRNTNISTKKVDFTDGSVLTETDLDNNTDQLLFSIQELVNKTTGEFFISAFNESIDGSRTDFTINNAPPTAQQIILSINGVVQKPNLGTSTPSEGFALDDSTIKLSAAPASGSDVFIMVLGTTVNLKTLNDNTVTNSQIKTNANIDSTKLSFTQAGTGANARTVDSKLKEILHFKDFGAVGDGSTNDATALLEAFNAATGKILDGGGLTYKCNSMLSPTSQNIIVQNATFDFSGVTTAGVVGGSTNAYIMFAGSVGSNTDISADVNVGANTFTVANTAGLTTPNSWHILKDDQQINTNEQLKLGQYIFIKSVDTTSKVVTLHNKILYKFLSASNAQVVSVTMKKNITFKNVTIKGANPTGITTANNHTGLRFKHCEGVTIDNCTFEDIDYAGSAIETSVNVNISNCTNKHHTATGLSYGFVIAFGCYSVNVVNCYAQDLRHFVTIGGNTGINLFVNVTNCHITGCRDAGVDSHAAGDFINFSGNTIMGSSENSNADGIVVHGLNCIVNDNIIVGIRRHAILYQSTTNFAYANGGAASVVVNGNQITNHGDLAGTSDSGILIDNLNNALGSIQGVTVANNKIEGILGSGSDIGTYGIYVKGTAGLVKDVSITGNVVNISDLGGIRVESIVNGITNLTITGNIIDTDSDNAAESGIFIKGTNSNSSKINYGTITNNVIDLSGSSGSQNYGIRLEETNAIIISTNVVIGSDITIFPATPTDSNNTNNYYVNNIG